MLNRLLIVPLCVVLALPIAAVAPAPQTGIGLVEPAATVLAAKGKKKPKFKTVTRTVRAPLTRTFTNAGAITIHDNANATPYPAVINVSGFANGIITDVNLTLDGFGHDGPDNVDILLAPTYLPNQNAIVQSDAGSSFERSNLTITYDDQAAGSQVGDLESGTFKPINEPEGSADAWPGQTPSGNVALSVFNGANPNGAWQLFVVDDTIGAAGQIANGWSLTITAEVDKQITEKIRIKPKKKGKKK